MPDQIHPYDPLTSENAALVLIDHQVGLMTGVRDYSMGELKHNVIALAKAAKVLNLPIIVTTTARDSMWGPTFPELLEALPGVPIIDRSSVNAFDDPKVAQAVTATGRKKLIFAGISLEVCAAFPAITAVGKGLDAPTSFFIGVAVNPSAADLELELERFRRKLDAGAEFAMTQLEGARGRVADSRAGLCAERSGCDDLHPREPRAEDRRDRRRCFGRCQMDSRYHGRDPRCRD